MSNIHPQNTARRCPTLIFKTRRGDVQHPSSKHGKTMMSNIHLQNTARRCPTSIFKARRGDVQHPSSKHGEAMSNIHLQSTARRFLTSILKTRRGDVQRPSSNTPVDLLLPLPTRMESREMNEQTHWREEQSSLVVCNSEDLKC